MMIPHVPAGLDSPSQARFFLLVFTLLLVFTHGVFGLRFLCSLCASAVNWLS
jgi:hypothetical protein